MEVPPVSHPTWSSIVSGKEKYQYEFLATKFLLRYLTLQVSKDPSPRNVQRCAEDLHSIFARNADLPSVQRDLKQIFKEATLSGCMNEVAEVKEKIGRGKKLLLAGDEEILKRLPAGSWIAGTIPYFMTEQGGLSTRDKIYVTELPDYISEISTKVYAETSIQHVYRDMPKNGFSIIIIPALCPTHLEFALNAPNFEDFAMRPLIGWISGVHLNDFGKITPKVIRGLNKEVVEDGAVVMHVTLQDSYFAEVGVINIFEQGDGDTFTFPENGFVVRDMEVNGKKTNFAKYILKHDLDTRLPLVADYFGTMVNVSIQHVDQENQEVQLYAPVFAETPYKHAKPLVNYVQQFTSQVPDQLSKQAIFSCNCILNYQYSELEGKRVGEITGPTTFGEVAYQLLNQTMVYLTITNSAG